MQALCRTTALCTHYVGTALRRSHQRCSHAEEQITETPGGRPTSDPTPYTPTPHPTPYTLDPTPTHRVVEDKLHPPAVRLAERVAALVPAIVLDVPPPPEEIGGRPQVEHGRACLEAIQDLTEGAFHQVLALRKSAVGRGPLDQFGVEGDSPR